MKGKLMKLSRWCFALAVGVFLLDYLFFHFLTDSGFTTVWQEEAGKPFLTEMVGILGVLFLFAGIMSLLLGRIVFAEKGK